MNAILDAIKTTDRQMRGRGFRQGQGAGLGSLIFLAILGIAKLARIVRRW